ncbi:MAG: uroporphyrinogen-III C-methyltransferase, partial [Actinomycetes bacterium]
MQLEVDLAGRQVMVVGTAVAARRVLRRYAASGATVTLIETDSEPGPADLPAGVASAALPPVDDLGRLCELLDRADLLVLVGLVASTASPVRGVADALGVLVAVEEPAGPGGAVTLVGGGPGVSSLLTLGACAALREADVVFYDRLAPTAELAALAPAAELLDVGKRPYHHPVSQSDINRLLVERARAGDRVVRLKGGDSFVFGRGGEEVAACLAAEVPVRVVPGVSSALAVPAAAGIPVTHRGVSHAFTVLSGHVPPRPEELAAVTALGGTFVILMGILNLPQITGGLIAAGMDPEMPAAII